MHLKKITLSSQKYPTDKFYPFNLEIFRVARTIKFNSPVTFFAGENGSGKSTLLTAISRKCSIHIWDGIKKARFDQNPYEEDLYKYIETEWTNSSVPGSFFASEIFRNFAANLDEWASISPGTLEYFGGKSLISQSHGQCHMSFFRNRFQIKGLYLLDEPENALSPHKQIELLKLLIETGQAGNAQFIIATHSPILLALPGAVIYNFDRVPIETIEYEDTEHYNIYKDFLDDRNKYLC